MKSWLQSLLNCLILHRGTWVNNKFKLAIAYHLVVEVKLVEFHSDLWTPERKDVKQPLPISWLVRDAFTFESDITEYHIQMQVLLQSIEYGITVGSKWKTVSRKKEKKWQYLYRLLRKCGGQPQNQHELEAQSQSGPQQHNAEQLWSGAGLKTLCRHTDLQPMQPANSKQASQWEHLQHWLQESVAWSET